LPPLRWLGEGESIEPFKKSMKELRFGCESPCAHLAGVVKNNSTGIEVWRGSLIQDGLRSSILDRGAVEALNPLNVD
jgi:hypothetical protein